MTFLGTDYLRGAEEINYRILKRLKAKPDINQQDLAKELDDTWYGKLLPESDIGRRLNQDEVLHEQS